VCKRSEEIKKEERKKAGRRECKIGARDELKQSSPVPKRNLFLRMQKKRRRERGGNFTAKKELQIILGQTRKPKKIGEMLDRRER